MFKHNGVQSILNEEKPSWNKIEPSIFFDESKCGPLHMLCCIIIFLYKRFPTFNSPLMLYIEFFKILPQMIIKYPIFYRTSFLKYH